MSQPDMPPMRASDADREAVAERLRVALNEGRLDVTEYDDRLQRAYAATTRDELVPLTTDLPEPVPEEPSAETVAKERERRKLAAQWRDWAGTSFLLVGIWAITSFFSGELVAFWPIFPVGIWAVVLLAGMLFGFGEHGCGGDDSADDRRSDGGPQGPAER